MSNFSPMFFEQPIVIFDTTQSLNATTGAFVLYGGLSINATYQSTSTSTGGFVLSGGMAVQKDVSVGGIQHIYNTTDSTSINDGALIVDGGVGIAKSLHVGGDTTILGNLFVQGTYTYVNTQTINVEDNTLVINAGPAGSGDGGVLIHRHGSDVVSGVSVTSGSNATIGYSTITLPDGYSQIDDYYRGWWIRTSEGNAQVQSYSAGNLVLATAGNTIGTGANLVGSFDLYNQSYMATYYAETQDEYRFAYVADVTDPDYQLDNFNNYVDVRLKSLYANESVSTGSFYVSGFATIANLAVTELLVASVSMENAELNSATIGTLFVTGASILHEGITAGTINVTGDSILHGGVTAGTLYVSGASILDLGVTAGTINVTGDSILHGGVTAGTLYVSGASILDLGITTGTINVTGDSILHGGVTAGTLYVSGASILDLGITTGGLYVTGASVFGLGLTGGSLNITGESWLQGAVTAGALNVTGNSILENNLTVTTGNVTISTNDYYPILDASSATGGSIIFNTVDVSPSLGDISRERIFTAANNQTTPADITNFIFSNSVVRAFDAIVSVTILTTSGPNKYAYYNLKGVQKDGNWVVNSSYVGDTTGFTFSITNSGQIQYTSTDTLNYDSSFVSFRALTTSVHPIA